MSERRKHPENGASGLAIELKQLVDLVAPLIRLELASIGAIETATKHETEPGYVWLFHDAKSSKQASVEQLRTVLRLAGQDRVPSGGVMEPVLRLEARGLQMASMTALLGAMRLAEKMLLDGYERALGELSGLARGAVEVAFQRARKRWMILTAHIARREDAETSLARELPQVLSRYFASAEDLVCLRCLLDRPGEKSALEKVDPYTYVCAACRSDAETEFPPDLQVQISRWSPDELRDRLIHKAQSRAMKLKAIKEVHALLAGLPPENTARVAHARQAARPFAGGEKHLNRGRHPRPSELSLANDGPSSDEVAYTKLLFDYRSVRANW